MVTSVENVLASNLRLVGLARPTNTTTCCMIVIALGSHSKLTTVAFMLGLSGLPGAIL